MRRIAGSNLLAMWASLGFIVLLCGPWVLPENKLYHQLIIFLLWVPALVGLIRADLRAALKTPECLFFTAFMGWTWLVMVIEGGDELFSRGKTTLYVALTLLGILLAARNPKWHFESMLFCVSVVGGGFAAVSLAWFLAGSPETSGYRVKAIGLWEQIIMAAHAVGALAIIGVFLFKAVGTDWRKLAWLPLPALGYALFLGFSQTRGVWIALLVCLLIMTVVRPSRLGRSLVVLTVVCLLGVLALSPEVLLQRGFSFRGALWSEGVELMMQHWQTGLGFHDYFIQVPETGQLFKHPHNLFLDTGVRLGIPGLVLFCGLWLMVGWRGWSSRSQSLGRALLALWVFSSVSFMSDGIGIWLKPNADWLITWLPVGMSIVLACRKQTAGVTNDKTCEASR